MQDVSRAGLWAAAGLLLALSSAHAQDATGAAEVKDDDAKLDTIVVTATKGGATDLQSTPLAVTALTADQLEERGISDVRGLINYTPGLQISDLSGYAQLYIRGVGSNTVFIGSDPSTTIHLDGVYLARPLSFFSDFLDVERIEVLRGPQGTLYGRNSVGGTINIISRRPQDELQGEVQVGLGNHGLFESKAYITGPLGASGIAASLAVNRSSRDAFFDNVSSGGGVQDEDSWGLRGQVLFPLGLDGEFILRADYTDTDEALGQYPKLLAPSGNETDDSVLGDYHTVSMNRSNRTQQEIYGVAGELNYQLSPLWSMKSLTAYRALRAAIDSDADSSDSDILRTQITPIRQHQISEELTFNARFDQLNLVLGAYYFDELNREPLTLAVYPAGFSHVQRPRLDAESYALFGQGEFFLSPRLSLIAGLRWTHETKDYELTDFYAASTADDPNEVENAPQISGAEGLSDPFYIDVSRSRSALTPKLGVNFQWTPDIMLFASATRGFKSGGYDYGASNAEDAAAGYGPEYLWSYELGAKTDWLDRRLRLNVDAFYYDYSDMQVEHFVNNGGSFGAVTENAASAEVKGLEIELVARPLRGLDMFANLAWLDATYSRYPQAYSNQFGDFDASGKRLNNAPRWSAALGANYAWSLGERGDAFAGVDYHYQTEVYFTPVNDGVDGAEDYPEQQGDYGLLNARIGWDSPTGTWRAMLVGSNLTDEKYVTGTANYTAAIAGRVGDPRTAKLLVSWRF